MTGAQVGGAKLEPISRVISTPVGPLTLVADPAGLRAVLWPGEDGVRAGLGEGIPSPGCGSVEARTSRASLSAAVEVLDAAETQLGEYFAGKRRQFELPLHLVGTEFQRQVWGSLASIPFGETVSYREQAERIGRPSAVRAVGAANGRNPVSIVLPCHRVVGVGGRLTGFAAGIDTKRWLLDHESGASPLPLKSGG